MTSEKLAVGTIYMMIAGFVFMLSNSVINISITHFLDPELVGVFGILMSFNYINWVLISSVPLATAHFIANNNLNPDFSFYPIYKAALKLQLFQATFFSLMYVVFSGTIANFLNDISLKYYLIVVGILLIPNAFLTLYLDGFYNGLCRLKQRAYWNILFSLSKLLFSGIFIYFGFKVFGLLAGFFLAIIIVLILCFFNLQNFMRKMNLQSNLQTGNLLAQPPLRSPIPFDHRAVFDYKQIFYFALPIAIATLAFTLMKNVPVLFIKYFLQDNVMVGLFTVAATLSSIPYTILTALSFTLLPFISKSIAENSLSLTKNYITKSLRYLFMFLIPVIAMVVPTTKELITIFYPPFYTQAGPILSILLISVSAIAIYASLRSIIIGSGKPKIEMTISLVSLAILCLASLIMVPKLGIAGAAWASLISSVVALVVAGAYISKHFKVLVKLISVIKILFCSAIIYGIIYLANPAGFLLLGYYLLLLLLYYLLLYLFGELTTDDLSLIKGTFGKLFKSYKHQL